MDKRARRNLTVIAIVTIISTTSYIIGSFLYYRVGYPLDDAWIYQTYARNLSHLGEWSFIPGSESGGSTGPLWVLFITVGYFLQLEHHLWTYLLGSFILLGLGIVGMYGFELLQPERKKWSLFSGLILILEWHLIWASVSGMETLLFSFVIFLTLVWLLKPKIVQKEWLFIGFLIGISVWIRPDGITLLGPAGLVIIAGSKIPRKQIIKHTALMGLGFAIPFGFYLIFNQITSGTIWPNTFYTAVDHAINGCWDYVVSRFHNNFLPGSTEKKLGRLSRYFLVHWLPGRLCNPASRYIPTWQVCPPSSAYILHPRCCRSCIMD